MSLLQLNTCPLKNVFMKINIYILHRNSEADFIPDDLHQTKTVLRIFVVAILSKEGFTGTRLAKLSFWHDTDYEILFSKLRKESTILQSLSCQKMAWLGWCPPRFLLV